MDWNDSIYQILQNNSFAQPNLISQHYHVHRVLTPSTTRRINSSSKPAAAIGSIRKKFFRMVNFTRVLVQWSDNIAQKVFLAGRSIHNNLNTDRRIWRNEEQNLMLSLRCFIVHLVDQETYIYLHPGELNNCRTCNKSRQRAEKEFVKHGYGVIMIKRAAFESKQRSV